MSEDIPSEVKEKLRRAIREHIEDLNVDKSSLPAKTIIKGGHSLKRQKVISKPGKLIDPRERPFEDVARWLFNSGKGWEIHFADDELRENPTLEASWPHYDSRITGLAQKVMDYSGEKLFTEDAFEQAFKDHIASNYSDEGIDEILVPISNFEGPEEEFSISGDFQTPKMEENNVETISLKISPLTRSELSGIFTYQYWNYDMRSDFDAFTRWSHAIRIKIKADVGGLETEITDRVLKALRLFSPQVSDIGIGPRYRLRNDWLSYREDMIDIGGGGSSINKPALRGEKYTLKKEDIEEFKSFWNEYNEHLSSEGEDELSVAIRRYNSAYKKYKAEDRLIDHVIGFESILLHEVSRGESYRFRLPLRGGALLSGVEDVEKEYVRKILKEAYSQRSKIVHSGKDLKNVQINGDELRSRDFVKECRNILRMVILRYLEGEKKGKSVSEINKEIDEMAQSLEYDL